MKLTGNRFRELLEMVYGKGAVPRDIEGREQLEQIVDVAVAEGRRMERDHLASLVGDDPCVGCEILALWPGCPSSQGKNPRVTICPSYAKYLGQLAQAAKGQQLLEEAVKQERQRIQRRFHDAENVTEFAEWLQGEA